MRLNAHTRGEIRRADDTQLGNLARQADREHTHAVQVGNTQAAADNAAVQDAIGAEIERRN